MFFSPDLRISERKISTTLFQFLRRRRNENMNGNSEDSRKPNFSVGNTETTAFQYTNPVTATVTNTYIQPPHYYRYNPSFPANSYLRAPSHHPFPSGELLYHHQYPPPIFPGAIPYTPVVMPKLSCYNCGSQSHFANDCTETTLEDTTKPSKNERLRNSSRFVANFSGSILHSF